MTKTIQRLLVFFLGIPLIIGMVILQQYNFLALNIVLCLTSVLSSVELCKMCRIKYKTLPVAVIALLTALLPISSYIFVFVGKNIDYTSLVFFVCSMIVMTSQIIFTKGNFNNSLQVIATSIFIIFYSGFFCTFITRMTLLNSPIIKISLFFLIVFISDSAAWLFGVLFGKNNKGVIKASPNKSVAGFAGGLVASILLCILAQIIFPDVLGYGIWKMIILGTFCNIACDIGDLVESVLKRSVGVKDSGNFIPGRGGMLDCVDSVFFTAPIFYVLAHILIK